MSQYFTSKASTEYRHTIPKIKISMNIYTDGIYQEKTLKGLADYMRHKKSNYENSFIFFIDKNNISNKAYAASHVNQIESGKIFFLKK